MKIDDRFFNIIVASDVDVDGLVWELWEEVFDSCQLIMSITRHDDVKKIDVTIFRAHIILLQHWNGC